MTAGLDDRHQIIDALNRLAAALDHRDWVAARDLMLPDVEAYGEQGVDAVVDDSLRRHLGGCGPSQHLLGNYRVAVDGDRADTVTYARVHHQGAGELSVRFFECFGEYHDVWHRAPVGWRLASRRFEVTMVQGDIEVLQPG